MESDDDIQPLIYNPNSNEELLELTFQVLNVDPDFHKVVYGYRKIRWRTVLTYIFSTLTCGLPFLVFHWYPEFLLYATSIRCCFQVADQVLIVETYQKKCKSFYIHKIIDRNISDSSGLANQGFEDECEKSKVDSADDLYTPLHLEDGTILNVQQYRYFRHKKQYIIWEAARAQWTRLAGVERGATCTQLHAMASRVPCAERRNRMLNIYGLNEIKVPVQSIMTLILLEVFNPFYVFQIFTIALWLAEPYYYYCLAIVLMSTFGVATSVIQTKKNQISLRATVEAHADVEIWGGRRIDSRYLAPGDVLILPAFPTVMLCDAVLLTGSAIVNESMLTGESVPVTKTALQRIDKEFNIKEHSSSVLFCGTEVLQTRYYNNEPVKALVLRTGYNTSKGELVRSILYPVPADFKFDRDSYKFIFIMAVIAMIGLGYTVALKTYRDLSVRDIVLKALDLITIAVPPALPAAMTVGRLYAVKRLARARVSCLNTRAVNVSGSLDCMCFDKTGTLTEDGLDMWGVVATSPAPVATLGRAQRDPRQMNDLHELKIGMATCHSLTLLNGSLAGDPLDLKMFESTGWSLEEPDVPELSNYDILTPTIVKPKGSANIDVDDMHVPLEVGIVQQYQFVSTLQRSSVAVRLLGEDVIRVYCKGAPEMLRSLCLPETVPENLNTVLSSYAEKGYRVIAMSRRVLEVTFKQLEKMDRDEVEKDLEFLGLIIMENRLKAATTSIIRELKEADLHVVMITGDNIHTAVSVAKECGILATGERVVRIAVDTDGRLYCESTLHGVAIGRRVSFEREHQSASGRWLDSGVASARGAEQPAAEPQYKVAMTGDAWQVLRAQYPSAIGRCIERGAVFARMSPDQKQQLVMEYQALGYYVGMCGDGANDCGALRAAHAGVSLSERESSVAAPFTAPDVLGVTRVLREENQEIDPSLLEQVEDESIEAQPETKYIIEDTGGESDDEHDIAQATEQAEQEQWPDNEISRLIIFYTDNKNTFLNGATKSKHLWAVACKTMLTHRNPVSCEIKFRMMKRKYIQVYLEKQKDSGYHWPFYNLCHQAFHDDPDVVSCINESLQVTESLQVEEEVDTKVPTTHIVNEDGVIIVKKVNNHPCDEKVELMLKLYIKHKGRHNNTIMSKNIWDTIALELGEEDGTYWHRRFYNFKKHYITMLYKKKETNEEINWPYMSLFDEIFGDDKDFLRKFQITDNNIEIEVDNIQQNIWYHTQKVFLVKYRFDCFHEFEDSTIPDAFLWHEVGRLLDKEPECCKKKLEELQEEHVKELLTESYDFSNRSSLQILLDNVVALEIKNALTKSRNKAITDTWKTEEIDDMVQHLYDNMEMFKDSVCYYVCWVVLAKKLDKTVLSCKNKWNELIELYRSILNDKRENPDMQIDWRYIYVFDIIFDYGMDLKLLDGYEISVDSTNKTKATKSDVPENLNTVLSSYAEKGYRVIAMSRRVLEVTFKQLEKMDRDEVEKDLEFLGLIIMENRLKAATTSIIRELKEADLHVVMITGDNIHTAVSVAKECGILATGERVVRIAVDTDGRLYCESTLHGVAIGRRVSFEREHQSASGRWLDSGVASARGAEQPAAEPQYKVAMTGDAWQVLRAQYPSAIGRCIERGAVFARMSPDQKQQLVMEYQALGYYVGMCGDGANDCGALRAAHAGVSLSERESSVAAPFTAPDVLGVTRVLREGRAALSTSFGVFKFMIAYSLTEFLSVAILYYFDANLTDFQFLYIDVALIVNFAFFFGVTEAHTGKLSKLPPLTSLIGIVPIASLAGQMLLILVAQYLSYLAISYFPWYVRHTYEGEELNECWENYAIFTVSMFQYVSLAICFSHGSPYRKSVLTNGQLMTSVMIMTALNIYITVSPAQWLAKFLQLKMPKDKLMCYIVLALASFNFVIALFYERFVIQYLMEVKRMLPNFIKERQVRKTPHLMIKRQLTPMDYLDCDTVVQYDKEIVSSGQSS